MPDDTKEKLGAPNVQQAIMQIIQMESLKARAFVPHMLSLGQLRERILRRVLEDSMPQKVSIETGLISHTEWDWDLQRYDQKYSRQIDILLYDRFNYAPIYQLDDFVVCSLDAAFAGIEVKSTLDKKGFMAMVKVNQSIRDLSRNSTVDGFGYGMAGENFDTLREHMVEVAHSPEYWKHQLASFPLALCCQDQNVFCVRPSLTDATQSKHFLCCAKARSEAKLGGMAVTLFIQCLRMYATNETRGEKQDRMPSWIVYNWYNDLNHDDYEKYHMNAFGDWTTGDKHIPPV